MFIPTQRAAKRINPACSYTGVTARLRRNEFAAAHLDIYGRWRDHHYSMDGTLDRGVSSVVGTVTVVALVVVLATGVLAAGLAMGSLGAPPTATIEADDTTAACPGCGPRDQTIELTHRGGDPLAVDELELVVVAPGHDPARVVDLPLSNNCLGDSHVEGPDLFDGRCGRVAGPLTTVGADDDGTWSAGETATLRLRKGAVRLDDGEGVTVRVVHGPSGSVVAERTVAVEGSGSRT
jgi:flagellin-like protein